MSVVKDICNELDNMSDEEFEAKWKEVCDEVGDVDSCPTVEENIDFLKGYKEQKEALDLIDKARENLMNMTEEEREELFKKCEEWNNVGPLVSADIEDYSVQDCYATYDAGPLPETFVKNLVSNMKECPGDIHEYVNEHFWEFFKSC